MKRKKAKIRRKKMRIRQKKADILTLTDQERDFFLHALEDPTPPNKALREAANRFNKRYVGNVEMAEFLTFDDIRNGSDKMKVTIEDVREDDYGTSLLQTTDAEVWAKAFIDIVRKNHPSFAATPMFDQILEEEWIIGWFANAMAAQEIQDQKKKMAKVAKGLRRLASSIK